jgi:hypothetical protein
MELHDIVEPDDRPLRRRHLAAAIRIGDYVRRQQRARRIASSALGLPGS